MNWETDIIVKHLRKGVFGLSVYSDKVPIHAVRNLTKFCHALNLNYQKLLNTISKANQEGENYCIFDDWNFSWMSDTQWYEFMRVHGVKTNGERNRTIIDAPLDFSKMGKKDRKYMEQTYARATDW